MAKKRADLLLVDRGLAETRSQAQRTIMAGLVRADGQRVARPADLLDETAALTIDAGARFVSRGGDKLQAALEAFPLHVDGAICADVGASTGGFTDCLLQHGAERVYAIDVGYGTLHWKLRQDARVIVMERTNARYVDQLPERINLVTIDASFISARILIAAAVRWLDEDGGMVVLVKPQFEAGRREVARGKGVVRSEEIHARVLSEVIAAAGACGLALLGLIRSPLLGPKGNVEFLAWFGRDAGQPFDAGEAIAAAVGDDSGTGIAQSGGDRLNAG